jgi:WD40 repeat protein
VGPLSPPTAWRPGLTLWKDIDGRRKATIPAVPWPSSTAAVLNMAFSPDGRTLSVTRYDPGVGPSVWPSAATGSLLATGGEDEVVRLWDLKINRERASWPAGSRSSGSPSATRS